MHPITNPLSSILQVVEEEVQVGVVDLKEGAEVAAEQIAILVATIVIVGAMVDAVILVTLAEIKNPVTKMQPLLRIKWLVPLHIALQETLHQQKDGHLLMRLHDIVGQ